MSGRRFKGNAIELEMKFETQTWNNIYFEFDVIFKAFLVMFLK